MLNDSTYRLLFDQNTTPMWVFDRETLAMLAVNEAATRLYGYSKQEFLTRTAPALRPPDDRPTPDAYRGDLSRVFLQRAATQASEGRHRCKDGTVFPVRVSWSPLTVEGRGAVLAQATEVGTWAPTVSFGKTVSDISSRFMAVSDIDQRINFTLAEMGKMSGADRAYLFLFREGGQVMDNTHEWCAEGVTPQIERLQGLESNRFPWWMSKLRRRDVIHIADVRALPPEASAERAILEGQHIQSLLVFPVQTEGTLAGFIGFDNVSHTGTWSLANLELLRVSAEIIGNALGRRNADHALRDKTTQLQAINDAMTGFLERGDWREASAQVLRAALTQTQSEYGFIGVLVPGPVLRILAYEGIAWDEEVNRAFYDRAVRTFEEVGYLEFTNMQTLFGRVITEGRVVMANDPASDPRASGIPPGHPPLNHFLGVPILKGAEVVGMIGVANRPGGYRGVEQHTLEILTRAAGVLYDSYRREQREAELEAQLRLAQKMEAIGKLAGGIAHDFNNVLTVITGYSHLLLESVKNDETLRQTVEEIRLAGRRASALTQQLLALSRRQVLQPKVLELNEILQGMTAMLQRVLGEDVHLVTAMELALGHVKADPSQLEQVIMNLVVNARDAMPHGGKLTIETGNVDIPSPLVQGQVTIPPGRYVLVSVSDTGHGMDRQTVARIFEPFFTTKEEGKGTGLGLSTVYGIVTQSGGQILVYSEPGLGSTFKVYLPRVDLPVEALVRPIEVPAPTGGAETLLVVEDDPSVREFVAITLRQRGYTVLEARHGFEALVIATSHLGPLHLLLTDVVLPQMGGRYLADQLREIRKRIKVLFMSGYTEDAVVHHGILDPGLAFLQKRFTPDELAGKVREMLDRSA
ncbi:MAG: GAF domain-containing protein [Nitrospirales bacterium]